MKPSRARHYKDIYPNIQGYCPFCGLESYVDPSRFTQDYDHILNKAKYPFAAVNLKNLVPMGGICNQKYKHQTDVISAPNGQRRVYPNPYAQSFKVKITLDGSILPSASQTGTWQINLISDDPLAIPYIETWDKVFSIKDRYIQSIVKDHYNDWLRDFILIEKGNVHDVNDLKARFSAKANQFSNNIYNDKKFLRYALFSFWATCNDNRFYESVLTQMRSL